MKMNNGKLQTLKNYLYVVIGTFILGLGTGLFLIPYNVVSGGVSGLSLIVNGITTFNTNLIILVLTWSFFFVGWILLGTQFALKTIISTILYPFASMFGSFLFNYLNFGPIGDGYGINVFLAALIGGAFVGAGVGFTFVGGGSTGGVDIISLSLNKYFGFKTAKVAFIVDAAIIVLGFIFLHNFYMTVIGVLSAFVTSIMVDKLIENERNMIVDIISKKYEEINEYVISNINRGSTIISGIGGYTKEEVTILRVTLDIREYYALMDIIAKIDPSAFVTVYKAATVRGIGFKAHRVQNVIGIKNESKK